MFVREAALLLFPSNKKNPVSTGFFLAQMYRVYRVKGYRISINGEYIRLVQSCTLLITRSMSKGFLQKELSRLSRVRSCKYSSSEPRL